ncbi:MAG: phosphatidylglycerol lysyltransferase domain-containing protein [Clostridiales bacterium]|uniref:DUF2156 domain-containing protein n=1 Tax=Evtepia sp. TaxID=2773933 RepID=UPI0029861E4C|nr:phosphatidylglycerol lysyltransferase domain-containing protein [Evtepia sp.]MDD7290065.1 phosphatidylglycerol lysyltransferase domain-containing protein [Clostridiales bacterium]MDY4429986.1 phosphatidylglycerol lysyltransferase domain-containing protein [Evtepia sp.]
MIEFRTPVPGDRDWVTALLAKEGLSLCNYSFPVLFCWQGAYQFQLARLNHRLLVRLESSLGRAYLWPVGEGDPAPALAALTQDAHSQGHPLRLISLTLYHKNWLEDRFPGRFSFAEARDGFDYLYAVDRLADLPGKKLHGKRNHIHRLDDACPGWSWAPLTRDDVPRCLAMDREWHRQAAERETPGSLSSLEDEHQALVLALTHREALGLEGVTLSWQGELLGFSLGAPLTDAVFDVHFERARSEIQGAYPAVNRSFAQYVRQTHPQIQYLNREDDMGVPGLRRSKLSYYPDHLLVNFCAVETPDAVL